VAEVDLSRVCVLAPAGHDAGQDAAAHELARRLGLPLRAAEAIGVADLVLAQTLDGLELREGEAPLRRGVRVDFADRHMGPGGGRRSGHDAAGQPLLRAIGRRNRTVVDATAGFGDDAIALASTGRSVLAIERSPVVAALLEDGHRRALEDESLAAAAARLHIHCGDAREVLRGLEAAPDVVYVDPMYPVPRNKSALPRRAIQLLRRLVGEDAEAHQIVTVALECGARRVVVKRPPRADPLVPTPAERFEGKLVRYDVYFGNRPAATR